MFKKLRNKLVLINLGITTLVIVVVFTTIYIVSTKTAENRPPDMRGLEISEMRTEEDFVDEDNDGVPDSWERIAYMSVREEKKNAADNLLVTLISSGLAIEIVVIIISYLMAEEAIKPVKETYEAQKLFIANASHEIKTPLAAISANLEAADIQDNKWISNIELETEKLTNLNNELLKLARTDLMEETKSEEVDLKAVVSRMLDSFEPRIKNKKLVRKLNLEGKVKINLADFQQILSILMDNAIKYSDKKIVVELGGRFLKISNDGAKVPAEKLAHIFERFYQVDKNADGVGLGLSIAKSLAERNHWKLDVSSGKMTIFTLTML